MFIINIEPRIEKKIQNRTDSGSDGLHQFVFKNKCDNFEQQGKRLRM